MGLILIPSEVKAKAAVLKSALNDILAGYQNVVTEINDFANDEALESDTWAKLKEKTLEYHSYISQGMVVVEESISADLSVLEQSIGDEDLYEDELINQINALEMEIRELENKIQMYETLKSIKLIGDIIDLFWDIDAAIYGIKEDIECVKESIRFYKEKLEFLYTVEDTTKGLFDSGEQLLIAMGALINEAGVKINHQKVTDSVNTITWDKLTKVIREQEKKTELYIDKVLQEELGISLEDLKELYGKGVGNELKRMDFLSCANENAPINNETIIVTVLEQVTGCSVEKVEEERYRFKLGNSIVVKDYSINKIKDNLAIGPDSWDIVEIIIPEVVQGIVNGEKNDLYPIENWGIKGGIGYDEGVQMEDGRYLVTVGPRIMVSDYPDDGRLQKEDFHYGKLDVIVVDKEGNEKIIKCVTGEVKAHTYNRYPPETGEIASFDIDSGLVQTGIAYPNSYNALHGLPFAENNIDSSIIEFRGQELDFNPSDYKLKEIVIIEE